MKKQISKVYVLSTIIGIVVAMGYQYMILWGNDKVFLDYERKIMVIALVTSVLAAIYQYMMYRKSLKTVRSTLGLD